jgi:hypothetical protein
VPPISVQGGSDISGTISMLHRRLKKESFLLIFSAKPTQLSAETKLKTNSHIPAKMNQQEGIGAGTVFRLCAGYTMIEIKSF